MIPSMASKVQQAQRFINFINQQLEKLKREKATVIETVDDSISQVQNEVDAWVNGGLVNQTTCAEMNNRIQHVITLFMTKSMELSDLEMKENKNDLFETTSATSNNSTIPITSHARDEVQETSIICRDKTVHLSDLDASFITTTKFAILEEAVFSLKKTTEQIQERQVNFDEKLEILTKANLKSKKKFQERLTELEKSNKEMYSNIDELFETATYVDDKFKKFEDENKKLQERLTALEKRNQELCSNVDDFFETLSNVDVKLNRLEEENKYVHVSMNKLNEQISFVKTCSNDALLSIQDLSKSVESTNQHYNEMSNKMDQLEISINVLSSKYTEQLENMERINEDKVDGLIGMVCQLISKRLAPLETLNETLKKKFILSNEHISKLDANDTQLAEISGKVTQIESIFNQPTLLFNACKVIKNTPGCFNIGTFDIVSTNNGSHFDPSTGNFTAPLSGFYLISIYNYGMQTVSYNVKCFQKAKFNAFSHCFRQLCCVSGNECVTCLVELKESEEILLQFETKEKPPYGNIRITFSCFKIK